MLVFKRLDDGRIHAYDRRRSETVADVETAARVAHRWGYTDLSIKIARTKLREAEGEVLTNTWTVRRANDPSPSAPRIEATKQAAKSPEYASPKSLSEEEPLSTSSTGGQKKGASRKRRNAAPSTREDSVTAQPTLPEPEVKRRSSARAKKPSATSSDSAKEIVADVPDPVVAPSKAKKRSGGRTPTPKPEIAPADTEAPAPGAVAEDKPKKPAPNRSARKSRVAEPASGPNESTTDPIAEVRALFSEGSKRLRELERQVLPFARGPWEELREMAERIVASLEGKNPKS